MALIEIFDFTDPYVDITNLFAYTNKNQICEKDRIRISNPYILLIFKEIFSLF